MFDLTFLEIYASSICFCAIKFSNSSRVASIFYVTIVISIIQRNFL
jgi:hypothetical protein